MNIPIQLTVSVYSEFLDQEPTHARMDIDEDLIKRLYKLERSVIRNKIAYVAFYDASPEYFYEDEGEDPPVFKEPGCSVECEMIVVRRGGFYWKGLIKHSEPASHYETEAMSLKDLKELIKFSELPLSEMPKYINDEDYSKREIALRRMKGEKEV